MPTGDGRRFGRGWASPSHSAVRLRPGDCPVSASFCGRRRSGEPSAPSRSTSPKATAVVRGTASSGSPRRRGPIRKREPLCGSRSRGVTSPLTKQAPARRSSIEWRPRFIASAFDGRDSAPRDLRPTCAAHSSSGAEPVEISFASRRIRTSASDLGPRIRTLISTIGPVISARGPMISQSRPVISAKGPVTRAIVPICRTIVPIALQNGPMILTIGPIVSANGPVISSNGPVTRTIVPICRAIVPVIFTNGPIVSPIVPIV
jgi:hypothetical protein